MKRAIAIFVKTPSLSPVKTRLASNIGEEAALEFYKHSVACVAQLCNEIEGVTPFWAVAEQEGIENWPGFDVLWTGDGSFAQRQHVIYSTLIKKFSQVMLIGADSPQLGKLDLDAGFEALRSNDYAIGAAADGGYTFFCGKKPVPAEAWEKASERNSFNRALPSFCQEVCNHTDVNTLPDLTKMLFEMPREKSEAQEILCGWTRRLLTS